MARKRSAKSSGENQLEAIKKLKTKRKKKHFLNYIFNVFAKKTSSVVGSAWVFLFALLVVVGWGLLGPYFHYSNTWQLVINTGTSIITFLVVFLIQNTQNRDTEILNLKIDELIRSKKGAKNYVIDLESLSDVELKELEKQYTKLCEKRTGQ